MSQTREQSESTAAVATAPEAAAAVEPTEAAAPIGEAPVATAHTAAEPHAAAPVAREIPAVPPPGVADQRHAESRIVAPLQRPAADADGLRQLGRDDDYARDETIRRER